MCIDKDCFRQSCISKIVTMQKVINTRALYVYDKTMITIVQTKIK